MMMRVYNLNMFFFRYLFLDLEISESAEKIFYQTECIYGSHDAYLTYTSI